MAHPGVGDPVYYKGNKDIIYVIVNIDDREDIGSMSYDRTYYLLNMIDHEIFTSQDKKFTLKDNDLVKVEVRGTKFPFTLADGVIPFRIEREVVVNYHIERKKARIIYE